MKKHETIHNPTNKLDHSSKDTFSSNKTLIVIVAVVATVAIFGIVYSALEGLSLIKSAGSNTVGQAAYALEPKSQQIYRFT